MKQVIVLAVLLLSVLCAARRHHRPNVHHDGTSLYMFACDGEADQKWTITEDMQLVLQSDGKCIDVVNWDKTNGAGVHLWTCHPRDRPENQQWKIDTSAEWSPIVSNLAEELCLDIDCISPDEGAHLHMWHFQKQDNQLWRFNKDSGEITSKLNGFCITAGWHYQDVPTCSDAKISGFSYCNKALTAEQRMDDLLSHMTLDEKLELVHGFPGPYVGDVRGNTRLGIPAIFLEDGPQGVADGVTDVTCWPSALAIVSTWNRTTFRLFGEVQAEEQAGKGTNVLLGPMHNLARVPVGGRNFESAGEDPYLASVFAAEVVNGIQGKGLIACSKHFVNNNHEVNRDAVSVEVDERTQWEMYYPQFQAAVDAGVASIMCSYNLINGTYACENDKTLNVDLKQKMGFKGYVMSDWGATHSTVQAANSGLDMQMPDASFFGEPLKKAIADGKVSTARLDDMVRRIVTPMLSLGMFETAHKGDIEDNVSSDTHNKVARDIAVESAVLTKNNGILPFSQNPIPSSIAVLGMAGHEQPLIHGGGSGGVVPPYVVTPFEGIKNRVGGKASVSYNNGNDRDAAAELAGKADIAIVVVGAFSYEGDDRRNLSLPDGQDALVQAVIARQPRTIVVVNTAGAVLMPWANSAAAILVRVMPGQEDGNALAAILFGDANPSGKLPISFPAAEGDTWLRSEAQYPGVNGKSYYTEKLLVGYRWYDEKQIEPLWPFGHGLSYTDFEYSALSVSAKSVSFTVKNIGKVAGAEVAQFYIGYPKSAGEPPKVLRDFQKVFLQPGASTSIKFVLEQKDLSIYDVVSASWVAVHGKFTAMIGSSSADIRLVAPFNN